MVLLKNKKLGWVLLGISALLIIILLQLMSGLDTRARDLGCFDDEGCIKIESTLSVTHFSFGIIGFVFALGFYLLFFAKSEEAIVNQLKEVKEINLKEEKFNLILQGLDEYEKRAIKIIKEQDGITQNTLRLKTDMSKAKLSYVLGDLEKRGLIKRVKKGKTFANYLKL